MPAAPETHKLKVEVIEATDLLAYDRGGTSDPLVRCQLFLKQCASLKPLQPILATKEVPKTLAPTWGETLEFEFVDGAAVLRCTVLDKNMLGTDLMGIVEVDPNPNPNPNPNLCHLPGLTSGGRVNHC